MKSEDAVRSLQRFVSTLSGATRLVLTEVEMMKNGTQDLSAAEADSYAPLASFCGPRFVPSVRAVQLDNLCNATQDSGNV